MLMALFPLAAHLTVTTLELEKKKKKNDRDFK